MRMGGGGVAGTEALRDRNCLAFQGEGSTVHPQAPGKGAGKPKGGGGPLSGAGSALRRGQTEGSGHCVRYSAQPSSTSGWRRKLRRPWVKGEGGIGLGGWQEG